MSRLPHPGDPNWGAELNDFLLVAHQGNGMLRNARPVINARDYGAVGDGATDDTGSLQTAIHAAAGGSTLFIPAGTYSTHKLLVPSEITILGEGRASVLQLCSGTCDALLTNQDWENGNQHIMLRDLRLEGNRADNDQKGQNFFPKRSGDQDKSHGVNFHGVAECLLENLEVNDFYYDGVYLGSSISEHYQDGQPDRTHGSDRNIVRSCRIGGSGRNGITITRGTDNHIVDNFLHANNIGARGAKPTPFYAGAITIEPNGDSYDVSRNTVQGNHLTNNHFNGVQLLKNWTSTGILLAGNVISGTARHGIAAGVISGLIIQGNHVSGSGAAGMALGMGVGIKDSVVSANIVVGNGTGIVVNGAKGERITLVANVSVGNGMQDQFGSGIVWVEAQQVTLAGNVALNNGATPRAQMLANGADPIYVANRVAPLGIPAASRVVRDNDIFAANWRLYGSDTDLYLQNQRSGKTYQLSIAPMV